MDQDLEQNAERDVKRDGGDHAAATPAKKPRGKRAGVRKGKTAGTEAGSTAEAKLRSTPDVASFKTRDLVDRVARVSGLKPRAAKPLVETVLAELGAVLGEGRPMVLRPLGKITVARTREAGGGQVLICRIRQRGPKGVETAAVGADESLAEVAEGS